MNILITGGAGFVGSEVAVHFKKKFPNSTVVAFDNLKRRGSELNLIKLKSHGVEFHHGDIRNPSDFEVLQKNWDVFFECSAEPSVLAGLHSSAKYLLETNLNGTINCLELAKNNCGLFIFLSTSRVYSLLPLKNIVLKETNTRFEPSSQQDTVGLSAQGISESFPTNTSRSLYGTTKLASEYLVQEYSELYGLPSFINRCGVIAGPGQFGKVDQGVYTLWVARHFFNQSLKYTGFGGQGKQVRDLIHVQDLLDLLEKQVESKPQTTSQTFNVGGGQLSSTSLLEFTQICQEITGNKISIESELATSPVDIPWYISDCSKVEAALKWSPKRKPTQIAEDIYQWIKKDESTLKTLFT